MSLNAVDFLRPPAPPRMGWWLLAAGVISLAAVRWCDQGWMNERREAERAQQENAEAVRAAQRPAAPLLPSATERRMQQARLELQRPWTAAFQAVETAAVAPVYLLSLSFEPSAGSMRLDAEAPSFERALAFTQSLADAPGLATAILASHEQIVDPLTSAPVVRFSVLARWSAPR